MVNSRATKEKVVFPHVRSLGDPDTFPAGDLGLQLAATRLGLADHAVGLARRANRWRPWRGYAAHYLWEVTP